jgi:prepilin-type N-terminal cleavage/methylation domain-containing protein
MSKRAHNLGAFTLIEVLMATVVMGIIMGALGSLFLLAGNTVASRASALDYPTQAADGLRDLADDLTFAQTLGIRERTRMVVTTQDRGSGGQAIVYEWSGTPGEPLVRTDPDGNQTIIIAGVRSLSFTYDIRVETQPLSSSIVQLPEQVVFSYDPGFTLLQNLTFGKDSGYQMAFTPTLPSGTISWVPTRFQLRAGYNLLADGTNTLAFGSTDTNGKLSRTDWTGAMNDSSLGLALDWRAFSLGLTTTYSPTSRVALQVMCTGGLDGVTLSASSGAQPGTVMHKTTNEGDSWSTYNGSMALQVWGRPWAMVNTSVTRNFVERVNATIVAGSDSAPSYRFSAALPNRPEVP